MVSENQNRCVQLTNNGVDVMPVICIQCAMRALLNDEPPPMFDETSEEHRRRVHPDPTVTQIERRDLEARLRERFGIGLRPDQPTNKEQ
jgi:hypothetical protein